MRNISNFHFFKILSWITFLLCLCVSCVFFFFMFCVFIDTVSNSSRKRVKVAVFISRAFFFFEVSFNIFVSLSPLFRLREALQ